MSLHLEHLNSEQLAAVTLQEGESAGHALVLAGAVATAKERFKVPASARVVNCYEAGRGRS